MSPSGEIVARAVDAAFAPLVRRQALGLESGTGTFGFVDPGPGRYEPIAELPGFTRGLDFVGRFAFMGSRRCARRPSSAASRSPSGSRRADLRRLGGRHPPGQTVAFLRFEDALQEIFAVQVVPGRRYPDLINDDQTLLDDSFVLTDEALLDVPDSVRVKPIP